MPHPLEFAAPDELDAVHLKLLRRQIASLARRSPFYRHKWRADARRYPRMETLADLAAFPLTEAAELHASLREAPPLGRHLGIPVARAAQRFADHGPDGLPAYVACTQRDLEHVYEQQGRALAATGIGRDDVVLHALPLSGGRVDGLPLAQAAARQGITLLPIGAEAGPAHLLRIIADQKPSVVLGTLDILRQIGERAMAELGVPAPMLSIRRLVTLGRPEVPSGQAYAAVEAVWEMPVLEIGSEPLLGGGVWAECPHREGLHFVAPGFVHAELIAPDSGTPVPFAPGARGELVYTSLRRDAMPVVRLRSHTHAEVVGAGCRCRRGGWRIRILRPAPRPVPYAGASRLSTSATQ